VGNSAYISLSDIISVENIALAATFNNVFM
jgi:hypothetical protein